MPVSRKSYTPHRLLQNLLHPLNYSILEYRTLATVETDERNECDWSRCKRKVGHSDQVHAQNQSERYARSFYPSHRASCSSKLTCEDTCVDKMSHCQGGMARRHSHKPQKPTPCCVLHAGRAELFDQSLKMGSLAMVRDASSAPARPYSHNQLLPITTFRAGVKRSFTWNRSARYHLRWRLPLTQACMIQAELLQRRKSRRLARPRATACIFVAALQVERIRDML